MLSDKTLLIILYALVAVRLVTHFMKRQGWLEETIDSLIPAGVTALAVIAFLVRPYYIPSGSMENTLLVKDLLLVDKLIYRFSNPNRGDIVVFRRPDARPDDPALIKRVVGVAGDVLEMRGGSLYRNGMKVQEPYIKEPIDHDDGPFVIKPGHLFMMGDNRNNSQDSRVWGQLPLTHVVGRAEVIVFPFTRLRLLRSQQGVAQELP